MAEGWRGERATLRDWEIHLSTLFPEVRLKRYIEVRGADAGPMPMAGGLAALWRGLLEEPSARAAAWALTAGASYDERLTLRREVPRLALRARLGGRSLRDLAVELCGIADAGLARLPGGDGDRRLLEPLRGYAEAGRSPADDLRDDFAAANGDPATLIRKWELKVD
jgi:glutamate--cysteine ligase